MATSMDHVLGDLGDRERERGKGVEEYREALGFLMWMVGDFTEAPEKVIFSGPATVAIFPDGSKVVAKCSDRDAYDKEKGLLMCLAKRIWGSKAVDILGKWCDE